MKKPIITKKTLITILVTAFISVGATLGVQLVYSSTMSKKFSLAVISIGYDKIGISDIDEIRYLGQNVVIHTKDNKEYYTDSSNIIFMNEEGRQGIVKTTIPVTIKN
jgi:hypothetical protein